MASEISGTYNKVMIGTKTLVDLTEDTITINSLLEGKTAHASNGWQITGTMKNNGDQSATLAAGGSKTIPAGYTSGGTVSAQSLSSQTSGTATAANILSGKTAWVNGSKVTGSMPDNSTTTSNGTVPGISSDYPGIATRPAESGLLQYRKDTNGTARISMSPPKGYYPGGGISYVNRPASEFGNATAADVVSGKTFTSASGLKVSGTIPKKLYSYYNKTTYGTTTVNDTKYICFNALDTGYYYNDSSNSSWAPELRVSEANFKTIARNTGLCVTPGDWEVFRDGAFQTDKMGIAPYYYDPSIFNEDGDRVNGYAYYRSDYAPLTSLTVQTRQSGSPYNQAAVTLSKWMPTAHIAKITIGYKITAIKYYSPRAYIVPVGKTDGASKSKWYAYGGDAIALSATSGSSYTGTAILTPNSSWADYFTLIFYARRYATLTINSIVLTIK